MREDSGYRYVLGRLADALDAWEADCLTAKANPERSKAADDELQAARAQAARVLSADRGQA